MSTESQPRGLRRMEQDKLNESLSKELLSNSMDVYKKTVKNYLDKASS